MGQGLTIARLQYDAFFARAKMSEPKESNYKKYPIKKALSPVNGLFYNYTNRYWLVKDDCLLFYKGTSPQCNTNRTIVEKINKSRFSIQYFESVFIPIHSNDFEYSI